MSRRRLLIQGAAGLAILGAGGSTAIELAELGILPGKHILDEIDGACSISSPPLKFTRPGPATSSTFYSHARRRWVGYTIAYPPGYTAGAELPLVVCLHGYRGNHRTVFTTPLRLVPALLVGGRRLSPMAFVSADGGGGYWNPHPGDNPMGMVIDEVIPMCQKLGLGRSPRRIGTFGISMGGYGAILLAEKYPRLISTVAAISPAVWTSYSEARLANSGAYASAQTFERNDAATHTGALSSIAVRVACGMSDPFYPGVKILASALPAGAVVEFSGGCHDGSFFSSQERASLEFLGRHLT
jgi:pimeloyl-ACP methyl ester carboxylesterase